MKNFGFLAYAVLSKEYAEDWLAQIDTKREAMLKQFEISNSLWQLRFYDIVSIFDLLVNAILSRINLLKR